MMIGYGDDDGDYDDKDYFRMNIISTLLSNTKSWEWGRVKIPWIVFGWNYSLVNYLPWMLPDSAFTATPHYCWNIALLLKHYTTVETLHCRWNFALPPKRNSLCIQPLHCVYIRAKYFPDAAEAGDDSASSDITAPCGCRITRPTHKPIQSKHSHHPRSLWCVHPASVDASLDASFLSTLCILQKSRSWYYRDWMDSEVSLKETSSIILESFHRMIDSDLVDYGHHFTFAPIYKVCRRHC